MSCVAAGCTLLPDSCASCLIRHVPHAIHQDVTCFLSSLASWLAVDTPASSFAVIPEGTEDIGSQMPANPGLLAEVARLLQAAPAGEQYQVAAAAMP